MHVLRLVIKMEKNKRNKIFRSKEVPDKVPVLSLDRKCLGKGLVYNLGR